MTIFVPGDPVGKERPRHDPRHPERRPHTPEKTKTYEEKVKWCFLQAHGEMIDGPVRLRVVAYFGIPSSASKKRQALMRDGKILPTKKPDEDNILKVVQDALSGLAYKDDAYVVTGCCTKKYGDPGVFVEIEREANDA
jgi:Holliday junction resolvase RusA-like endonuclease